MQLTPKAFASRRTAAPHFMKKRHRKLSSLTASLPLSRRYLAALPSTPRSAFFAVYSPARADLVLVRCKFHATQ